MCPVFRSLAVVAAMIALVVLAGPPALGQQGGNAPKGLEQCWTDLSSPDAMLAFKAMGEMYATPKETVAFMATRLAPVPAVPAETINKLVDDLDSDTFAVRQKATKELEKLGRQARPALEKMLTKPPSAEAQSRAKKLVEQSELVWLPEELRQIRSVEVLERIASPEARELLARLAKGAPGARQTDEAKLSMTRLK
jgi:hypothetical protein